MNGKVVTILVTVMAAAGCEAEPQRRTPRRTSPAEDAAEVPVRPDARESIEARPGGDRVMVVDSRDVRAADAGVTDARAPAADGSSALFKPVHDTFATFCADCHHGDYSGGQMKTYNHLMGMTEMGTACDPPRPRVKRGDPENSVIYQKISRDTPSCGRRMPLDCKTELGNCLTTRQIAAVRAWIVAGAPPPGR